LVCAQCRDSILYGRHIGAHLVAVQHAGHDNRGQACVAARGMPP
jgi:hypothetical protein